MKVQFLDPNQVERLRNSINNDPEFKLAARYMSKDILLEVDDSQCIVKIRDGIITGIELEPANTDPWNFAIRAPADSWEKFLQPLPPPFYNHLSTVTGRRIFKAEGDLEALYAHFWAMSRMLDVLRQLHNE